MKSKFSTKRIAMAGLLAALTVAGSAVRITIPVEIAGPTDFHLGNIVCALCGILLGPGLGGLAAGMGSAIYDMTNPLYISECWITFLTKGAYGVAAGLVARNVKGYRGDLLASITGALTYAMLYLGKTYLYGGRILGGMTHTAALLATATKLPATIFNAVVPIVCAPLLASAIRRALEQNHLTLE